jgi:hypothetical protein
MVLAVPAMAQETQPGDACTGGEAGYFKRAESNPMSDGGNFMICDGSNWVGFMHFSSGGQITLGTETPFSAAYPTLLYVSGGSIVISSDDPNTADGLQIGSAGALADLLITPLHVDTGDNLTLQAD